MTLNKILLVALVILCFVNLTSSMRKKDINTQSTESENRLATTITTGGKKCDNNNDCDKGWRCPRKGGECVQTNSLRLEQGRRCDNNSDCDKGWRCPRKGGQCVQNSLRQEQGKSCDSNSDCEKDEVCTGKNGKCTKKTAAEEGGKSCDSNSDCEKDEVCTGSNGKCKKKVFREEKAEATNTPLLPGGARCRKDGDCQIQICDAGRCLKESEVPVKRVEEKAESSVRTEEKTESLTVTESKEGSSCKMDSHCGSTRRCLNGKCEDPKRVADSSADLNSSPKKASQEGLSKETKANGDLTTESQGQI